MPRVILSDSHKTVLFALRARIESLMVALVLYFLKFSVPNSLLAPSYLVAKVSEEVLPSGNDHSSTLKVILMLLFSFFCFFDSLP